MQNDFYYFIVTDTSTQTFTDKEHLSALFLLIYLNKLVFFQISALHSSIATA